MYKSFGLLSTAAHAKFSGICSNSLKVDGHRNKRNISYAFLLTTSGWKAVKRLPWVWSYSFQYVHNNCGKFRNVCGCHEGALTCQTNFREAVPPSDGRSIGILRRPRKTRDRSYRVRHSLNATKLFPKHKEAAVLANKIRHTNLQHFLDGFTAIFTTNSPVYVSEAARTWFASLVKWTGLDGPGVEPQSGTFRTRPDRTWGPPSYLYNGYRVFSGHKAADAWRWQLTPFLRQS
jgi:hypothetical protein